MNIENKFPKLHHFLGAYFHQDCYDDGDTSDEIVNAYIKGTDNLTKIALITEIRDFLIIYVDELKITERVKNYTINNIMFKFGAWCPPMPDNISAFDWLVMIEERLKKEIGSENLNSK